MTLDERPARSKPLRPPPQYTHTVAFRLTDEQAIMAEHLRASFEFGTWAEMGRWFFDDPVIRERIRAQITEGGVTVEREVVLGD